MAAPDARPVIVAYDGSEEAQHAVREAAELFHGRLLVIVSVWEPGLAAMASATPAGPPGMAALPPDMDTVLAVDHAQEDRAAQVAEAGAKLAHALGGVVEAHAVPDEVNVSETISRVAEERDAKAIVVGSRGLGGFRARLLGSTSRGVLSHTHRPVLVVQREDGGASKRQHG